VGRLSEVTVLFANARGFTSLIHEHGPEEITPYIDEFFRRCSNIVINHDGIIDHFRGDAVFAFFNVPVKREDHLAQAIESAREIQSAVPEINRSRGTIGIYANDCRNTSATGAGFVMSCIRTI